MTELPAPRRVAVFCGSSMGVDPVYADAARHLVRELAAAGYGFVYGGGHVGLMGVVADTAMAAGAEVVGVIPQFLADREVAHDRVTHLEVVDSMHARKATMAENAGAFVSLPGGIGTLEEHFEVWTWQQLGRHTKPVALYDVNGFWDPLIEMIDRMVDTGFVSQTTRDGLIIARSPDELISALEAFTPPQTRWSS